MRKLSFVVLLLSFYSCASSKPKAEQDQDSVSVNSALNLAKTSYIKGCVDGIQHVIRKKTYGKALSYCKTKSEIHKIELESIIQNKKGPKE